MNLRMEAYAYMQTACFRRKCVLFFYRKHVSNLMQKSTFYSGRYPRKYFPLAIIHGVIFQLYLYVVNIHLSTVGSNEPFSIRPCIYSHVLIYSNTKNEVHFLLHFFQIPNFSGFLRELCLSCEL